MNKCKSHTFKVVKKLDLQNVGSGNDVSFYDSKYKEIYKCIVCGYERNK